jgi:hypothetical protein
LIDGKDLTAAPTPHPISLSFVVRVVGCGFVLVPVPSEVDSDKVQVL